VVEEVDGGGGGGGGGFAAVVDVVAGSPVVDVVFPEPLADRLEDPPDELLEELRDVPATCVEPRVSMTRLGCVGSACRLMHQSWSSNGNTAAAR
jgi:hypothetical protein